MSTALYTLIGALGGVIITQIANYFLEAKRAQSSLALKKLELEGSKDHDLQINRRQVYARYLLKIDQFVVNRHEDANEADLVKVMDDYYSSLILAGESTAQHIMEVFKMAKRETFDTELFNESKAKLLVEMKNELQ